jgi:hypothetical protein
MGSAARGNPSGRLAFTLRLFVCSGGLGWVGLASFLKPLSLRLQWIDPFFSHSLVARSCDGRYLLSDRAGSLKGVVFWAFRGVSDLAFLGRIRVPLFLSFLSEPPVLFLWSFFFLV